MPTLSRRLQILLEESQADALDRESQRTGRSVAALIREAIDRTYLTHTADRAAAVDAFLAAPAVDVEDWALEKRRLRDELAEVEGDAHPAA